jgi:hypothetical protein
MMCPQVVLVVGKEIGFWTTGEAGFRFSTFAP